MMLKSLFAILRTRLKIDESFVMSVRIENWAPTERIFMKFDVRVFHEILSRKLKFH